MVRFKVTIIVTVNGIPTHSATLPVTREQIGHGGRIFCFQCYSTDIIKPKLLTVRGMPLSVATIFALLMRALKEDKAIAV